MNTNIIKGTTPTLVYTFNTVRIQDITTAVLTVKRSGEIKVERDLTTATVGNDKLSWTLTQAETLDVDGQAEIMLNWKTADGVRGASDKMTVQFIANHKEVEI